MRKRYRVMVFAALVAALAVPVGYAWTVETKPVALHASYGVVIPAPDVPHPGADAAKLLGIGSLLFGLAAVVRKAV
jgi:hypothetical protein